MRTWRTASYAIVASNRGGGEVAGLASDQVVPSHTHVAFPTGPVALTPTKNSPPNMTVLPDAAWKAMLCPCDVGWGWTAGEGCVQPLPSTAHVQVCGTRMNLGGGGLQ